ncbi:unnamed protein product [Brugia pahangi]|uniref:Secreted protein n=1 Tax=Brugia pahangi TaxID=6280 RepID=A0A0N4TUF0_BRUPA|nr:unnamed protein product [Brugia pahangi]
MVVAIATAGLVSFGLDDCRLFSKSNQILCCESLAPCPFPLFSHPSSPFPFLVSCDSLRFHDVLETLWLTGKRYHKPSVPVSIFGTNIFIPYG